MIHRTRFSARDRRAMILMVVLALLTLFTIVGITFVYISDSYATSARLAREAENLTVPDVDPELASAYVLGQLIYDVNDDAIGTQSALRGWSLARNMYGWNNTATVLNDKAYAGMGRLTLPGPGSMGDTTWNMVNYQYFSTDGFVLDPERLGQRANPSAAQTNPYVPGNVPYTYPDQNNMFVAHLDATKNTIATTAATTIPSFNRPWLVNLAAYPNNPYGYPVDANWTNAVGKYRMLRPRPVDHMVNGVSTFPYPEDQYGDVKNLDGAPGGNDSIWIDPGGPVLTAPNGVKYKMLVAPLILPLDGRINVNSAGNVLAGNNTATPTQAGNQGFGPYEVSLKQVMTKDAAFPSNTEWINLFLGITPQVNPNTPSATPRVEGRYGPSGRPQQPASGASAPSGGAIPRAWARIDLNGLVDPVMLFPPPNPGTLFTATSAYTLPATFDSFPIFPGDGYNDGYPRELSLKGQTPNKVDPTIHPLLYNPIRPGPGNRIFSPNDMAAVLRAGGTGSDYLESDLLRLCPINFSDLATRNLLTTLSFDLDRPAPVPYVWDRKANPWPYVMDTTMYPYTINQPNPQTSPFNNTTVAAMTTSRTATPTTGEFDPTTWRSLLTLVNQVNVNRPLTNYPTVDPTSGMMATDKTTLATFAQAQNDRTTLARDIFRVLQMVTGARNPSDPNAPTLLQTNYPANQWNALRYLAQVSVNLVDFIDSDDLITPFLWTDDNKPTTTSYVFGVELPRLVINETYVQINNDPTDTFPNNKASKAYQCNVWAELLNPLNAKNDPAYSSFGTTKDPEAWLTTVGSGSYPIYRLKIAVAQGGITSTLRDPSNVNGDPGAANVVQTVTDFGTQARVLPVNGAYSTSPPAPPIPTPPTPLAASTGFYVIGPTSTFLAQDNPNLTASYQTANMMYTQPLANPVTYPPTVVLQRLLCPGLPPVDPNDPLIQPGGTTPYNPYITIDYVENTCPTPTSVNDMRQYLGGQMAGKNVTGYPNPQGNNTAASTYSAMGRREPYAAAKNQWVSWLTAQNPPQSLLAKPLTNSPQNTFYAHNGTTTPTSNPPIMVGDATLRLPFDWPVHLDRQVISKTELIYASTCKPHEFTQLFYQNNTANSQNIDSTGQSVWQNQNTLLYRFFEFATITPRVTGFTAGCRVAGRVNINLMFNPTILNAICDPQPGNNYASTDVNNMFSNIVNARQTSSGYTQGNAPPPAVNDTPYWGFGVGFANGGDALSAGARGLLVGNQNVFQQSQFFSPFPTTNNPYQQFEMLNKITNNITTRSNVYGIWLTFGFFEVVDSTTTPPTLGAEIGKSENRNIRHRSFAIVDRTNLQIFQTTSKVAITPQASTATGIPVTTLSLAQTSGTVAQSGFNWQVQIGSVLTFDPNTNNEETVVVVPDANGKPGAIFYSNHAANCTVISRGNPGPSSLVPYNPRNDPNVVLYYAMIN